MPKAIQDFMLTPGQRIPRADWDRAPWNRWTFQHVREMLPTAERLERFFTAAVELMTVLARAAGHHHLGEFSIEDLTTYKNRHGTANRRRLRWCDNAIYT